MKQCINPTCVAAQQGWEFEATDRVCSRCGQPLATVAPGATVGGHLGYPPPAAAQPSAAVSVLVALLLLLAVFAGVFALTNFFRAGGVSTLPVTNAQGTPNPVALATMVAQDEATRVASGTMLPNTPIPPDLPTPVGGGASSSQPDSAATAATAAILSNPTPTAPRAQVNGGSGVAAGVSDVRLCKRFAPSQSCEPITAYTRIDPLNVAVLAGFGPGGARSAQVHWYGPDGALLFTSDPVTPTQAGTFWVGFTLQQSQPWHIGVYRADIYLDGVFQQHVDIPVIS